MDNLNSLIRIRLSRSNRPRLECIYTHIMLMYTLPLRTMGAREIMNVIVKAVKWMRIKVQ